MNLDMVYYTSTAFLIASVVYLLMQLVIWQALAANQSRSVVVWVTGGVFIALGLFAIGIRPVDPDWLPFGTGFALTLTGSAWMLHALRREAGLPCSLPKLMGLVVLVVLVKEWLYRSPNWGEVHFAVTYLAFCVHMLAMALTAKTLALREGSQSALWFARFSWLMAVLFGLRVVLGVGHLVPVDTMTNGWIGFATSGLIVVAGVVHNAGFLGVFHERSRATHIQVALEQERSRLTLDFIPTLSRLDKQRSLAELAGSLAHELAQPITGVLINAQTLSDELRRKGCADADIIEIVSDIQLQASRASEVLLGIKSYIKSDAIQFREMPLMKSITMARNLFLTGQKKDTRIDIHGLPDGAGPHVVGDGTHLSQVFLNVFNNAFEARRIGQPVCVQVTVQVQGRVCRVEVSDNGTGMTPEAMVRHGDAFFTTKEDGMGIGLAISKRIVEQHGGRMGLVQPQPNPGASVFVELPLARV